VLDAEDVEDLEDAPDSEVEAAQEEILDQATAARTIAELRAEIDTLKRLETLALSVRRGGSDYKMARACQFAECDLHDCAVRLDTAIRALRHRSRSAANFFTAPETGYLQ
jgi:hypothetical protein